MSKKYKNSTRIYLIIIFILLILGIMIWYIYKNHESIEEISNLKNIPNLPQTVDKEIQVLMDLKSNKGPKALLDINCLELTTNESKKYCTTHQKIINNIYKKHNK